MNIVIATSIYPPEIDPLARYIKRVAKAFSDEGHQTRIVAQASTAEKTDGAQLVVVGKQRFLFMRLLHFSYALLRNSHGADVIYAQNALAAGLPAVFVSILRRIPVVVHFFEDEAYKRSGSPLGLEDFLQSRTTLRIRVLKIVQKLVLTQATRIVVSSETLKKILVMEYSIPETHVCVTPPIIETPPSLPFLPTRLPHTLVTTSSHVRTTLQAAALLKDIYSDIQLLLIGNDIDEKCINALVREAGLEAQVRLLGRVSQPEKWYRLLESSVFVHLPTKTHTATEVLLALRAGCSVVASDLPVFHGNFLEATKITHVSRINPDSLVSAIKNALSKTVAPLDIKTLWEEHVMSVLKILSN